MYAIVKTGGKQYRVERGQTLLVERLPAQEGADVALEPILYRSEDAIFDRDGLAGVKVTAKVVAHVRGEKLRVAKFKPKRGYKRRTGHRQELTRIEVTEISAGRGKAAKQAAAKPAGAKETAAKAEGAKESAAKQPAAKAAAAKPPAAKQAAAKQAAAKPAAGKAAGAKPATAKPAAEKPARAKAAKPAKEDSKDGS